MDFELHVVRGRSATQALKLADGVNSVGRHDDCTVRIKSSQVSRRHCELFEKQGKLVLKDLGSANGTFVNGEKVEGQRVLDLGDELSLGGIKLRVAKVGQAPVASAPGKAPSDTAVVKPVTSAGGADDEFEIDFEDEVSSSAGDEAVEFEIDDEFTESTPTQPAAQAQAVVRAPEKSEEPAPTKTDPAATPTEAADEAIADFLLDINVDDDD